MTIDLLLAFDLANVRYANLRLPLIKCLQAAKLVIRELKLVLSRFHKPLYFLFLIAELELFHFLDEQAARSFSQHFVVEFFL